MLSLLHIENIAVVEQADIVFGPGFNVLSGETGAGKSIIIDAIGAILGERTYREVIRTGKDKAFVSAVFHRVPPLEWFADNHVPYEEELLIQREIFLDGRNICRVNGQGVSVTVLRSLGQQLIAIHGQHDSQQLFDEQQHLRLLDAFAADEALLAAFGQDYSQVRRLQTQVDRLAMDESEKLRRQEALTFQISELSQANLQPGEDVALEAQQKRLMNAERLRSGINGAAAALWGDEDNNGAVDLLVLAQRELAGVSRYDESLEGLSDKLQQLIYAVQDVAEELRDCRESLSDSEDELEQIDERLDLLRKLKRKYGTTCEDMLAYLAKAQEELDEIIFADDRKARLEKELSQAMVVAQASAQALQKARKDAAKELSQRIMTELAELNMPRVQFRCEFSAAPMSADGIDSVRFLMSANAGEAMKPLSKVASGGELARIMLAMKNVLAEQDAVTTMIFDEVDAGVSGRAAQKVAEKLVSVAKGRQVLCVTHLPQIAALAQTHLLISKSERQGRTYTQVESLDFAGRTQELARMIGGAVITDTTRKSAQEMLRQRG